jgi:ATP-dependent DNA helicase RecQ
MTIAEIARESGISEMAGGGTLRLLEDAELIERADQAAEVGKTGRSRRRVTTILARGISSADLKRRLEPLLRASSERRARGLERVSAMERYAWGRGCRHRALLRYFGDDLTDACAACDSCCDWKPKGEGVDAPARAASRTGGVRARSGAARKAPSVDLDAARPAALVAASAVHRRFGMIVARQVLRGSRAQKVVRAGLDQCPAYGALARLSDAQVDEVLGALEAEELIESGGGPRPVILLTEEGRLRLTEAQRAGLT